MGVLVKARRIAAGVVDLATSLFWLVALAVVLPLEEPFEDVCKPRSRARGRT
jgi:hypothetical protein